jgi:hypothetical protein
MRTLAALSLAFVLSAGCLLLDERPLACEDAVCPGHYSCGTEQECLTSCTWDAQCEEGFHCVEDVCEENCSGSCPDGFSCNPASHVCNTTCYDDLSCAEGYSCCMRSLADQGLCPTAYACF